MFEFDPIAAAQSTSEQRQPVAIEPNLLPQLGGAAIGGAVMVTMVAKLFEKFGDGLITNQQSKSKLEVREKELELQASERQKDIIYELLNTFVTTALQGSRESKEIYYGLMEKLAANTSELERLKSEQEAARQLLKGILEALKERNS